MDDDSRSWWNADGSRQRIMGAILREATASISGGNDPLQPGERLIIFTTHGEADRVRDYSTTVTR
jgi:hypothetical protein